MGSIDINPKKVEQLITLTVYMEERFSLPFGLDAISLNMVEPHANLFCIQVEVKVKILNRTPDGEGRQEVLAMFFHNSLLHLESTCVWRFSFT